jgi:hypothetical protein
VTRVGTLELRVPPARPGRFSAEIFSRHQRREKASVTAPATSPCSPSGTSSNPPSNSPPKSKPTSTLPLLWPAPFAGH